MTSFIACISGRLRRGRGLGSSQDRGDGLQHACHQVLQHQLQQVTRCHGVIATSFRSPDIFRSGIHSWYRKTCGEYHSMNNLILTMQLSRTSTNHHQQHWLPKLSTFKTNPAGLGELRALAHLRSTAGPDLTSRCSTQLASRRSR